jgi:hypothetical protein
MGTWDLAIDIGVAAVVAAVRDEAGIELVTFDGRPVLPALVRCSDGPPQAGVWLEDDYLAEMPGTVLLSPKRLLISPATLDVREFPAAASELYGSILLAVAAAAEDGGRDLADLGRLILTHPVVWTDSHLDVLHYAAVAAGLPDPEFIAEPLAAAWYLGRRNAPGEIMAILDAGDSSVDYAVLERTENGFAPIGTPGSLARTGDDPLDVTVRRGIYEVLATIKAADLAPEDLAGIYVIGGASRELKVADLIDRVFGIAGQLEQGPLATTVVGALIAARDQDSEPDESQDSPASPRRIKSAALVKMAIAAAVITLIAAAGAMVVYHNVSQHELAGQVPVSRPATRQLTGLRTPAVVTSSPGPHRGSRGSAGRRPSIAPSSPSSLAPSPSPSPSPGPTGAPDPETVVQSFFAAINEHDYAAAWRLGGYHFVSTYAAFVAGFATTVRDIVTITAVYGDNVALEFTAIQTNGTSIVFDGTYAVSDGIIIAASVSRAG